MDNRSIIIYHNISMATPHTRKATFVLPAQVLEEIRRVVKLGLANSASALVREALELRLRELWEEQLRQEFATAARDPAFLADIDDTMAAFHSADAETARMIPE